MQFKNKYTLEAEEKTSIQYFKKNDFLHERVDRSLINNMNTSCKQYKQVHEKKKEEQNERKAKLNIESARKNTVDKRTLLQSCKKS